MSNVINHVEASTLFVAVKRRYRWTLHVAIDGLLETSLPLDQNPTDDQVKASLHRGISIVHRKSDGHRAKTPIHQKTHDRDQRSRSLTFFIKRVLRDEEHVHD